jgi:hypothetical protein
MSGAMTAGATVGAAAIGTIGSLYGANKNAKAASSAMSQQQQMAQQQLAFQQQQYNRYLGLYGGTEQNLANQANSTQPLDYEQNYAAIKGNYGDALRNISSSMAMRGIAGSGLDVGAERGAAMGQANALSGAFGQGLINRRNLGLSLTGRGQMQQAGQGYAGGMQNLANLYGQQAGMYNQGAQMGWHGFGQNLGNFEFAMQNMNKPQAQDPYTQNRPMFGWGALPSGNGNEGPQQGGE